MKAGKATGLKMVRDVCMRDGTASSACSRPAAFPSCPFLWNHMEKWRCCAGAEHAPRERERCSRCWWLQAGLLASHPCLRLLGREDVEGTEPLFCCGFCTSAENWAAFFTNALLLVWAERY